MAEDWASIVQHLIEALKEGDVSRSRQKVLDLAGAPRIYRADDPTSLSSVWEPFTRLLHRRGYYVSTPELLERALVEIREMGPGFDLYDLAAALAQCDAVQARRLEVPSSRLFPELRAFSAGQGGAT